MVFYSLLAALAVIVGLFFYSLANPRTSEGFTEVYFKQDPEVKAGSLSFSFVVANHEGKAVEYAFEVFLGGERLDSGKALVEDQGIKVVKVDRPLAAPLQEPTKLLVSVSRDGKPAPYTLWYWVGEKQSIGG